MSYTISKSELEHINVFFVEGDESARMYDPFNIVDSDDFDMELPPMPILSGWYWRNDEGGGYFTEPIGPFDTEDEALADATGW